MLNVERHVLLITNDYQWNMDFSIKVCSLRFNMICIEIVNVVLYFFKNNVHFWLLQKLVICIFALIVMIFISVCYDLYKCFSYLIECWCVDKYFFMFYECFCYVNGYCFIFVCYECFYFVFCVMNVSILCYKCFCYLNGILFCVLCMFLLCHLCVWVLCFMLCMFVCFILYSVTWIYTIFRAFSLCWSGKAFLGGQAIARSAYCCIFYLKIQYVILIWEEGVLEIRRASCEAGRKLRRGRAGSWSTVWRFWSF